MNYLLIPGAWMGSWIWDDLIKELQSLNHNAYSITLPGLNLTDDHKSDIGLEDHIAEVIEYIDKHKLADVILVGHSYSGFVVGQIADRIPTKISKIIFIEAILPMNDKTMLECAGLDVEEEMNNIEKNNGLWPQPTLDELRYDSHLTEKQINYLSERFVDHPGKTVTDPAKITNITIPATFIGASSISSQVFKNMNYRRLEGGHWPMLTKTKELAENMTID